MALSIVYKIGCKNVFCPQKRHTALATDFINKLGIDKLRQLCCNLWNSSNRAIGLLSNSSNRCTSFVCSFLVLHCVQSS